MDEFTLIERFFHRPPRRPQTRLGVGDDCALLQVPADQVLAVTLDTLVAGVHFFPEVDPEALGHKALAVNLSDLAAVGAEPVWGFLALTLPRVESDWLERFAKGLFELAERYRVDLAGGDTTCGPLTITLQTSGWVPENQALKRSGARPGDGIYLSGWLGDAGLGLKMLQGEVPWRDPDAVARLLRPEPRVELGLALRGLAHACIDVSDGLAADLHHVLHASGVGATIEWEALPLSPSMQRYLREGGDWRLPLQAGEDYELCFTMPPCRETDLERRLPSDRVAWHRIGTIEKRDGLRIRRGDKVTALPAVGYRHF